MNAADLIELSCYPIDRPGTPRHAAMLDKVRADLAVDGCAVLKGFVRSDALPALVSEADRVAPQAHRSYGRTNAYFSQDEPGLPETHPVRRFYDRSNAFIPGDNFGADSGLRAIYEWPAFMPFVRACLDEPEDRFFRYDDPLADVIINAVDAGNGFPWHFDTNNYTVTLAI